MTKNKILFTLCTSPTGYSLWAKRRSLLDNPNFDKYYDRNFLEQWIEKCQKAPLGDTLFTIGNIAGQFLAQNIETSSRVIEESISVERLETEIQAFNPTHICFSIMLDAYQTFTDCSRFLRQKYPHIKIVAGNVGALAPQTPNFADYICKGEGTAFLRRLLEETPDTPLRIPRTVVRRFRPSPYNPKKLIEVPTAILTTNLGCGMGCDFCITYALYRGNYKVCDAQEIKDALLDMGQMINKTDVTVIITDPLGLADQRLWEEVIDLMRGENYCFHLNVLMASSLIMKYSKLGGLLDKFKRSAEFELALFEIGLETMTPDKYTKNRDIKWRPLIKILNDHGIISVLSQIIGFDHHTYQGALQEVREALAIEPAVLYVSNLKILYETKLWYLYEQQHRLLDVPPEFRMLGGYFAFTHPHFRSGFEDCLPLMIECEDIIKEDIGSIYSRSVEIIKNRPETAYNENLIRIGESIKGTKSPKSGSH